MRHIIITGHSKGLGEGVALELINSNHHIHGIARTHSDKLQKLAAAKSCKIDFYPCDLLHTDTIPAIMQQVFSNIEEAETDGIYLINNAGIIEPIGPIETLNHADVEKHIHINLLAPMHIMREFVKQYHDWPGEKRVLSISSGAATNPYHGWSCYSTGKAALDMYTRCAATEQEGKKHPIEFMGVAPGIIDTGMQTTIRATNDKQFIHRQKFVELKESGQLIHPSVAGKRLVELLFFEEFENGKIMDIRDRY